MGVIKPKIIKESFQGLFAYRLEDELLMNREIECLGSITSDSANSLISQIRYLNYEDKDKPITMFINSPGGEVTSGLAIYDVMMAVSSPIHTVCLGTASSMAAILFAAGESRKILPHAKVMIHDPLISGNLSGSALNIQSISDNLMRTREITANILAKHTKQSIETIYANTTEDTYFYAEDAIQFGLADEILSHFERS